VALYYLVYKLTVTIIRRQQFFFDPNMATEISANFFQSFLSKLLKF